MGLVFQAEDPSLKRLVAVKVMLPRFATDPQARQRFIREAQAQAKVEHDHVVPIYGVADDRNPPYIVMPLLKGMTLAAALKANPRPPLAAILRIGREIAEGLAAAHENGLIHRDIKPANVYLCSRGAVHDVVKVLDFGLVREFRSDGSVTGSNLDILVGTPLYLSPEAILSPAQLDSRADIYALGALAYVLLTGAPPFAGRTLVELCGHHLHSVPEPPSSRGVTVEKDLEDVVLACLAKEPSARPQTALALAERLRLCRDRGSWGEAEAELWWTQLPRHPHSEPVRTAVGMTLCCADVKDRLRAG